MSNKPVHCQECPLHETGRGFVLGIGDPHKSKISICLDAPNKEDILVQITNEDELNKRAKTYPEIDAKYRKQGRPASGSIGLILEKWVLDAVGIKRDEIFIDHVLRCMPPPNKQGKNYPIGEERHQAEKCCRYYDKWDKPSALVLSLHPSTLLKEVTPLPLMVRDAEKAKSFQLQGHRVLFLLGGMAAKAFARFGDNISKWRGSYSLVSTKWYPELIKKYFSHEYKKTKKTISKVKAIKESIHKLNPMEYTDHLFDVTPKKSRKKKVKKNVSI